MGYGMVPGRRYPSKKPIPNSPKGDPPVQKPVATEEKLYRPPFSSWADIMEYFNGIKK